MKTHTVPEHTYIIGDVHGCYHTMQNLISRLPHDAKLIFVGDLCDKGNFSKEVIDFVIEKGHLCVKGNHEHLMQTYLRDAVHHDKHSPWSLDHRYGGIPTLNSYGDDHHRIDHHLAWIERLPTYLQIGPYFITHGFALPFYGHRDDPAHYDNFLLNRYEEGMDVPSSEVINIFGHCVVDEAIIGSNFCAIDTGCSYGGKLTAIELGSLNIYQEPMDQRDSSYIIKELFSTDLSKPLGAFTTLQTLIDEIDARFKDFDLISLSLAKQIHDGYGLQGKKEIMAMMHKGQLFKKQAKQILGDWYDLLLLAEASSERSTTDFEISSETLNYEDQQRLIEMAWQDRTHFDTIRQQFGLSENEMKKRMRTQIKPSAYKRWRKRVQGRKIKHKQKCAHKPTRFEGPW